VRFADFSLEKNLWEKGFARVAGVDEVGRGAWAGPVLAAAVVFSPERRLGFRLADSKQLSPARREALAEAIKEKALFWSVSRADAEFIEANGIGAATEKAIRLALAGLKESPEFVLVDYFKLSFWPKERQDPVKFGDAISNSIAAASILAKVARDSLMRDLGKQYPQYGFEAHKGYGTKFHREMIKENGLCPLHRRSFVPKFDSRLLKLQSSGL
jgi:ribonuclease HII